MLCLPSPGILVYSRHNHPGSSAQTVRLRPGQTSRTRGCLDSRLKSYANTKTGGISSKSCRLFHLAHTHANVSCQSHPDGQIVSIPRSFPLSRFLFLFPHYFSDSFHPFLVTSRLFLPALFVCFSIVLCQSFSLILWIHRILFCPVFQKLEIPGTNTTSQLPSCRSRGILSIIHFRTL